MNRLSRSLGTPLRRSFNGGGRAPRREFIAFVVVSQAPVALADWLGSALLDPPARGWLMFAVQALVFVPLPALMVRRLHDMGLSGRWSWLLLPLAIRYFAVTLLGLLDGETLRAPAEWMLSWVEWLLYLPAFALYMALLAGPARNAAVRFGPNPRPDATDPAPGVAEPAPDA